MPAAITASVVVANGSYTSTPSAAGYTFSPASISITINNANVTGQNFTATATVETWGQKADFGGDSANWCRRLLHREQGLHRDGNLELGYGYTKDFWEYDPAANTWTQKADFGGTARHGAVGFSIGSKGYIGTGRDALRPIIKKTSGSTTLPPIPGHRRPISGGQRERTPSASPSGARAT